MTNEQMKSLLAQGLTNNIREVLHGYDYVNCRDYGEEAIWRDVKAEVDKLFTADFIDLLTRIQGESE